TGGPPPAAGVNGDGVVLVVWRAAVSSTTYDLHARRFSAAGVAIDASPITIATGFSVPFEAEPTVAGATDGWMVAWASQSVDADGVGVAYVIVDGSGSVGAQQQANIETYLNQNQPSVAWLGDRYVVAWTDQSVLMPGTRGSRIEARMFEPDGTASGGEIEI